MAARTELATGARMEDLKRCVRLFTNTVVLKISYTVNPNMCALLNIGIFQNRGTFLLGK